MLGLKFSITVDVNFPALSDLVAYLNGKEQSQIDLLATAVRSLTARLRTSEDRLKASVQSS